MSMNRKTMGAVLSAVGLAWTAGAVATNDWWTADAPLVENFPKQCTMQSLGQVKPPWTFLHDPAIVVHQGTVFCAWYNCTKGEMVGESVIRGTWSTDGGETWAEPTVFAADPAHKIHYVPPAFGTDGQDLFLFVSKMTGPDRVFELEIYKKVEGVEKVERVEGGWWKVVKTVKAPFLINTNAIRLGDGRWICGGRVAAKVGDLPTTPAVMISKTKALDGDWEIVPIDDGKSPDGQGYYIPETALIVEGMNVTAFTRCRNVTAVVHESTDGGKTWDAGHFAMLGDRTISWSKMYGGVLKDGRRYLVCNLDGRRDALTVLLAQKGEKRFSTALTFIRGADSRMPTYWYFLYPSAVEKDGRLWVLFTASTARAGLAELTLEPGTPDFVCGRIDAPEHVRNARRFEVFSPYMKKALDFMRRPDLMQLPVGRYEIDGSNCWAMVQRASFTKFEPEMKVEAHRRYIDIQMPLETSETYGVAWLEDGADIGYNAKRDVGFTKCRVRPLLVRPEEKAFVAFLPPHGAHAPGCTPTGGGAARKLVIKIRVPDAAPLSLRGAEIAVPEKPADWERLAANDLASYLTRLTGAKSVVVPESAPRGKAARVWVGRTKNAAAAGLNVSAYESQQFRVAVRERDVFIVGGTPTGTSYGVSDFLADRFNVYTVDGGVDYVPRNPLANVPGDLDYVKKPNVTTRVVYRRYSHTESTPEQNADMDAYFRRNYLDWPMGDRLQPYGHRISYRFQHDCHTFQSIMPPSKYFAQHPEWFSMNEKGERIDKVVGGQLCLSNPALRDEVTRVLLEGIAADRKDFKTCWPNLYELSQNDSSHWICLCPACKALAEKCGGQNGLMLDFVNDIAARVAKKYPDVMLRTFAYECTENPEKVDPSDRVVVRYCDFYSKHVDIYPLSAPENKPQYDRYRAWIDRKCRMELWDYVLPCLSTGGERPAMGLPVTAVDALIGDMRLYAETGLERMFLEAEYDAYRPRTFRKLEYFLMGQLLFDASREPETLIDAYMVACYGAAAPVMRTYLDRLRTAQRTQRTTQKQWEVCEFAHLTPEFYAEMRKLVSRAVDLAKNDPVAAPRVAQEYANLLRNYLPFLRNRPEKASEYAEVWSDYEKAERLRLAKAPYDAKTVAKLLEQADVEFAGTRTVGELPPELKDVPATSIRVVPCRYQGVYIHGKKGKDPASESEQSIWWVPPKTMDDPRFKHHLPVVLDVYAPEGKGCARSIDKVPADGKYHWYRVGTAVLDKDTKIYVTTDWHLSFNISSYYAPAKPGEEALNRYEVWVSLKAKGPTYVPGSKDADELAFDRALLVHKPAVEMEP